MVAQSAAHLLEKRLNSCEPLVSWRAVVPPAGCWYEAFKAKAVSFHDHFSVEGWILFIIPFIIASEALSPLKSCRVTFSDWHHVPGGIYTWLQTELLNSLEWTLFLYFLRAIVDSSISGTALSIDKKAALHIEIGWIPNRPASRAKKQIRANHSCSWKWRKDSRSWNEGAQDLARIHIQDLSSIQELACI